MNDASKESADRTLWAPLLPLAAAVCVAASPLMAADSNLAGRSGTARVKPEPAAVTPRELFNAGTRKLQDGKLGESETLLQSALLKQEASVRAPALYNLGHVRFAQGAVELKKAAAGPAVARGAAAHARGQRAGGLAREALAGSEVDKLLAAYLNGRGARKELRAAKAAVQRALETHGAALRKWQRALGDFKSAAELQPSELRAEENAEIVEREIAKLVDTVRELQQLAAALGACENELGQLLQGLKGRIPADLMPPGADGDEDEEDGAGEEPGTEPKRGERDEPPREGPGREGEEIQISPEEAGWILESFQLDGNRRLPMGEGEPAQPQAPNRRHW